MPDATDRADHAHPASDGTDLAHPPDPLGIAIVGPTATGKSVLALEVARRLPSEIISVDTRQVYRGMDIGTAKPSPAERAEVPHHGLDLVDPAGRYSAGRFARDARRWIAAIRERGRTPLLVGGTGFFLRALTHPLFKEPPLPAPARRSLRTWLEARSREERLRWLAALDPASAGALRRGGGRQREVRALEVALLSGRPIGAWHAAGPAAPAVPLLVCALDVEQAVLAERIERRLRAMVDAGLPAEVRDLAARFGAEAPGLRTPGYAEFLPWLAGETTLPEAVETALRATRRLARRQRTWFRHQLPGKAVRLDGSRGAGALADDLMERWETAGAGASHPRS